MSHRALQFVAAAGFAMALVTMTGSDLQAQGPGRGRGQAPASPEEAAPIDVEGYWVAIVNEDWRWRMVTPPKGDYASVPLTPEGRAMADMWDESEDGSCMAYGVGGLMRMPTRLNITWPSPDTLQIETDAGQQTRTINFQADNPGPPSLQGYSVAEWDRPARRGRGANAVRPPGGNLEVMTTNMTAGWLRKNGVPYSENAVITEYFDRFGSPNGDEWLSITTIVDDPIYLNQPFITSSHFKREADGSSNWNPTSCRE